MKQWKYEACHFLRVLEIKQAIDIENVGDEAYFKSKINKEKDCNLLLDRGTKGI